MLQDNEVPDYNRTALAMISATHFKGGQKVTGDELKMLVDNPEQTNWPALVGALIGLGTFLLEETDDPDEVLRRLGLVLAGTPEESE